MHRCRKPIWTGFCVSLTLAAASHVHAFQQSGKPAAAPPATGPKWVLDEPLHDFGTAWAGLVVQNKFVVRNEGVGILKLIEAKPHCSCSVADDYTREIPQGESGTITFTLQTASKSGQVQESIVVKTNDPTNPYMTLEMKGFVKTVCKLEVIEDSVARVGTSDFADIRNFGANFGRVTADQHVRRVIKMTNTSGSPLELKLLGVNQGSERFRAELKETKPKEEYELTVIGEPPFVEGYNSGTIMFGTNISDNPAFNVGAYAYVPARIEVVPPKMIVDPKYPIQPIRALRITNNGSEHFEITSVSCSNPGFRIKLLPLNASNPKTREIEVRLPLGQYRPPEYGDIVRVETNDAEKPLIDVYVLPRLNMEPAPRPADLPLVFTPGTISPGR
ncbi:MAG: DUF1573 domain-containing protein [Planctomycetia bacterium]|jgi:hypothetical protein|nr:DUF1573 domain-containing protein [Planctomycetia bacterium]MCC7316838.1 DUF1573 domain-containing protein [Planctomycetota bacterium]OQZ05551.1 MAG: hypothetical protein B6D36_09590 [Planctomycetes bacterium UTPLA1]